MGDLSAHFSTREFACPDGCGFASPNPRLITALEQLRAGLNTHAGDAREIRVHDGCRCAAHNAAVGGVPGSEHQSGLAADISVVGVTQAQLFKAAVDVIAFAAGGIGVYPESPTGFIHVDVRLTGPARWVREKGTYRAMPQAESENLYQAGARQELGG